MFNTDPSHPPDAISAVKALQKASAAGQRIYHLTAQNQSSVLSNIHHDADTLNEIQSALATGKEVITHTDAVSVPGWSGAGYIIFDPVTGDGAYKIGGGGNGSYLTIFAFFLAFLGLIGIVLQSSIAFILAVALTALTASLIKFFLTAKTCGNVKDDVNLIFNLGIAAIAAGFGVFGKVGGVITSTFASWIYGSGISTGIEASCK